MGILDNVGAAPQIGMGDISMGGMPPLAAIPPALQSAAAAPVQPQQTYPGLKKPPPPVGATVNGYTYMGGDPRSKDPSVWKPASGDAFLSSLPIDEDKKTLIKMMANYEAPSSGTRGIGSPEVQQLVGLAKQYDPTFDVKNYKVRQDYLHDLNDQKANGTIQALNNAALHAKSFDDEYQKLGNSNWLPQFINRPLDYMGKADTQKAAGAVSATANFLGPEIARVGQGAAPTVDEVNRQMDSLDVGARPNVEQGTMASMAQKIGDRLMSMQAQYRRAFGNQAPKEPLLTPEAALAAHQLLKRYAPDYENKLDFNVLTAGGFSPAKAQATINPQNATPKGVDPVLWQHMTPEERSLWTK
jgi:hypothetical protein